MFNLDAIRNKNNKDDDKKWSYRMLIIGPSGSGKNDALLNVIQINKIMIILLARFICTLKTKVNQNINF